MITYFPAPYEDELLYSWLARYYAKAGYISYSLAAEDLFINIHTKPSIEFINCLTPSALAAIERFVPRRVMVERHTMFPYYARFLDMERRRRAFEAMVNMDEGYFNLLCVSKSKEHAQRHLRYCPICAAADRTRHGETYWHRIHQLRGVNICPTHGCNLIDTSITIESNGSPSLITAEETISYAPQQYHTHCALEWQLAQYIADVFQAEFDMRSDVSVGMFLHSRLEGTRYLSQRGKKRNMTLLYSDFRKYYSAVPVYLMEQWQMQKIFSDHRLNTAEICMLAMFLNIPPLDLVHMNLPGRSQIDTFDAEIKKLHAQGLNYRQIAEHMNASYDVVKSIGEGAYGRYHYYSGNMQQDTRKKFNWDCMDRDALPQVKRILYDLERTEMSKPERISVGKVERLLGWPKKRLRMCPLCLAEVNKHVLSQEEYWQKLISWAEQKLISEGKSIHITAIMRLTNIRKKDFARIGYDFTKCDYSSALITDTLKNKFENNATYQAPAKNSVAEHMHQTL